MVSDGHLLHSGMHANALSFPPLQLLNQFLCVDPGTASSSKDDDSCHTGMRSVLCCAVPCCAVQRCRLPVLHCAALHCGLVGCAVLCCTAMCADVIVCG